MSNILSRLVDSLADEKIYRKPNDTPEENLARVGARRSIRLIKAISAGVIAAPLILVPAFDVVSTGVQKATNYMADVARKPLPGSENDRVIPQVYAPSRDNSGDSLKNLLETFAFVSGVAVGAYAGRKGYLVHEDRKKLDEIQGVIDRRDAEQAIKTTAKTSELAP